MDNYVLDTSALLTIRQNEEGTDQVEAILQAAQAEKVKAYISFMSLSEAYYIIWQRHGKEVAYKVHLQLRILPMERVDSDESLLLLAGELKAIYSLSIGDSYSAATAIQKNALLVHKDPDFDLLKDRVECLALPYKRKRK